MSELRDLALQPLPLGAIKPRGWLRRQLRIQADGISGHLDEFWPDVRDSAWFGGQADSWERAPYWLDGLVPLAFALDNKRLIDKVLLQYHEATGKDRREVAARSGPQAARTGVRLESVLRARRREDP